MRLFLFVIFQLLYLTANAQSNFNSDEFWKKLKLEKETPTTFPTETDTAFIVASSRQTTDDTLRFIGDGLYKGPLHYYYVHSEQGIWHVYPTHSLSEAMQYVLPLQRDWVIYADGFGKIFTEGMNRGIRMNSQYGVNVLYLDYPSFDSHKKLLGNYRFAKHNAKIAWQYFLPVLDSVRLLRAANKMGDKHLSVFLHSMGNIILRQMVRKHQLTTINQTKWVDNLILNSPCVPRQQHHKWLNQVQFAQHTYLHYNPKDFVLRAAFGVSLRNQLGAKPRRPLATNVNYINFHVLTGKRHSNFLYLTGYPQPFKEALQHYNTLFHGDTVNLNDRTLYAPSYYHHIGMDILPTQ